MAEAAAPTETATATEQSQATPLPRTARAAAAGAPEASAATSEAKPAARDSNVPSVVVLTAVATTGEPGSVTTLVPDASAVPEPRTRTTPRTAESTERRRGAPERPGETG